MFLGLGKDNEYYCLSVPTSKKPKSVSKYLINRVCNLVQTLSLNQLTLLNCWELL